MGNLKEIKARITSISSTMQITSAMKMVSAAKLRRAQDAITQMRPYSQKLQEILSNVSATLDLSENAYADERAVNRVLIIAVSSNRGLCGGFNNNITKRVNHLINSEYPHTDVHVLSVGKKVNDAFKNTNYNVRPTHLGGAEEMFNDLSFERAAEVAAFAMAQFVNKTYDEVLVIYNSFKNAAVQEVMTEQLLPLVATVVEGEDKSSNGDYIFEPSKEKIITDLIPKTLKLQFYKAVLDSNASEHGARMTAMHKATDNASAMKKDLKLEYNKARQAAITNEILEIVGGAEALKGN
jgi:F-type H+-transporting ATPase subunit gamma